MHNSIQRETTDEISVCKVIAPKVRISCGEGNDETSVSLSGRAFHAECWVASRQTEGGLNRTEEQIIQFRQETAHPGPRQTVVYCRVGSQSQRADLKNQRRVLEEFCLARGLANVEFVEEIGGGMNFGRKKFLALMDAIEAGTVGTLIVAHKDRLTRLGYEWFERFCQRHACDILVLNQEHLSPEEELVQDLLTITQVFSARLYGLRNYRKQLHETLDADVRPQNPVGPDAGASDVL